ncbi:MAG: hypothetical protein UHX00_02480 [Caryophanon sp.]|nr:hypothetical protein [Caryophanon sp.]
MNKWKALILLIWLMFAMIGSYVVLRAIAVSDAAVIGITLLLLIACPLSIYALLIRPNHLPKPFLYVAFVICLGAAYVIIPPSDRAFLNKLLVWLIPIVEVTLVLFVIYSVVKTIKMTKNRDGEHEFLDVVKHALEPKLGNGFVLEAMLTELNMLYYGVIVFFKKPMLRVHNTFSYHKTSQIKLIVIVFSLLIVVEGVLFHLLLQRWSDIAAWIFTILNVYALLYIVGLYNSVRFLPHVLDGDTLTIRLGYQSSVEIDVRNIAEIQKPSDGGIGQKIPKSTYYSLLMMDSPQYEFMLKEPVVMKSAYGKKKYVSSVVMRCDEPQQLLARLPQQSE